MKKAALIFQNLEGVHLYKDVGIFPAAFSEYITDEKSIIIYSAVKDVSLKGEISKNLELKNLKSKNNISFFLKSIFEIFKCDVDFLILLHLTKKSLFIAMFAKILGIKTYIKSDFNYIWAKSYIDNLKAKNIIYRYFFNLSLRFVNLLSVEDVDVFDLLKSDKNFRNVRIELIPNLVLEKTMSFYENPIKKQEVAVVGRIGAFEKNIELILECVKLINSSEWNGWKIKLYGAYDEDFYLKFNALISEKEFLRDKIILMGGLQRSELLAYIAESKIFLMSSRYEGFSLAALEAAWLGCYIISTKVGGIKQLTKNGDLGTIYEPDPRILRDILVDAFSGGNKNVSEINLRRAYISEFFNFKKYVNIFKNI